MPLMFVRSFFSVLPAADRICPAILLIAGPVKRKGLRSPWDSRRERKSVGPKLLVASTHFDRMLFNNHLEGEREREREMKELIDTDTQSSRRWWPITISNREKKRKHFRGKVRRWGRWGVFILIQLHSQRELSGCAVFIERERGCCRVDGMKD